MLKINAMAKQETIDSIIEFWFSNDIVKLWFNSNKELDLKIKSQFEPTYQLAVEGKLDDWQSSPLGCLALILLFDQFPLNMYRGSKESFATESRSREVAAVAIKKGFDRKLSNQQKVFCYMPYMHSEDLGDQAAAIELYAKAGLKENLRFAKHHYEIVERFGRFPHRNKILGRTNSSSEEEYLNSKQAFLG